MFKKLFSSKESAQSAAAPRYTPYRQPEINQIYHLLFCDDPDGFRPGKGQTPAPWQQTLFSQPPNPSAIRALAEDSRAESRVRALAYHWLRSHGQPVPPRVFLGTIIEVALEGGLDALAAYTDGRVRYINHTGHMSVIEGGLPEAAPVVGQLLSAAQAVVQQIGPWDKQRLPPPKTSNVRFSFLVSDGLYFGEGGMTTMQNDPMGGPLLAHGSRLLQIITNAAR